MKTVLSLLMCFSSLITQAQECSGQFIENVEQVFKSKTKDFNKKSYKNITGWDFKQIEIINVPVIFVTKEYSTTLN